MLLLKLLYLFCHVWFLSLGILPFYEEKEREIDLGERGCGGKLRGVEGEETVVGVYCM